MKRIINIVLALSILATLLIGCSAQKASTELSVLCGPQEEWCQGMKQEFEKKYNITVNYVRLSGGEALARVQAEKANPTFDIWWGGSADQFVAAAGSGLLETYNSPNFKNLLDQVKYKDKNNQWVGIYVGTLGFCTNSNWLAKNPNAKAPTSWADLLKPEFKGQVMVAHPSTSATSFNALSTILQIMGDQAGWDYIKKYAGQISQYTKSGAAPAKFVGQGEAAVGIVFSHDIVNEVDNNKQPLVLTFPSEGTGYEIGAQAILKGAKHLDAAKKWYDWAISADAQALGPKYKAYQAPTVKGVTLSHPELLQVKLIDYNLQWSGDNRNSIVDKFTNQIAAAANLK
jgi:iron(III) transport system substrate-binding protein